ncbi:UDP-N-acetylmuramoyl-L-alanine--D-glutamate ligase [Sulfurospirillum sp. UCH001]|uniref:UDP-N-acetylmuramoyl-L-alanine--D-glutamate ligase n=1 Tax=Sulfurospirillum sp. UCH001 TaxID=1581011 RepID=UPI00082FE9A5|nr:UDP-N-acetylmuramoyl-L-alanine--D-glutamate ligase [Sulfurospirillum sp. UCH001]
MITLFGHGKTTKAIAKRFAGQCQIFDDNFVTKETDAFGNLLLPPSEFDPNTSDVEIPSPGFPTEHPLIQKALHVTSEYDFFKEQMPFSIWISGTNGKTTTTQMCEFLLQKQGALAGGNIGTPLAELSENAPIWILETSSFTFHYTKVTAPDIYLLLPIKPDHLTWHGSMEAYIEAKLSPLSRMREGSVAILPKAHANVKTLAHVISYENEHDLAETMGIDISKVNFKTPFLLDAILAMSAQKVLLDTVDYDLINTFKIDHYKIEEFRDKQGRLWVDDSKGTNVDATIEALKRYKDDEILIVLGGDDKGVDLQELFDFMKPLHVTVFAIGSNTERLASFAQKDGIKLHKCFVIEEAMKQIHAVHTTKSVALLSPAAASLDQFKSYAHRGDRFKELALA